MVKRRRGVKRKTKQTGSTRWANVSTATNRGAPLDVFQPIRPGESPAASNRDLSWRAFKCVPVNVCVFVPSQVRTVCCCCQEWHCQKLPHTFSRDKSCLEASQRLSTQSDINTAAAGSRKVVGSCFVLTARPDDSLITDFNFILERRTCSDRQFHCDYGCHSAEATKLSPPISLRLNPDIYN